MKKRYQIDQQRAVREFRQLAREQNSDLQMIARVGKSLLPWQVT